MQKLSKSPSLNQLRYFVTVSKHLNFRRAAHILGITQPTLTNQIATLEETLGICLFERSRTGTLLTAQGRSLLQYADNVLSAAFELQEAAQTLSTGEKTTYRLGIPPTLGPYLLPHILPDIHKLKPGLKFYVREGAPKHLSEGLLSGEYDLILSPMPHVDAQIQALPLFSEPLKFVLPADHPLAGKPFIEPKAIKGEKVLTLEERHHFHFQVQSVCSQLGAVVDCDYEGTSLDTLRQMVVMGMGMAFLPGLYIHSELHHPEALHVCEIKNMPIVRHHMLAWRNTAPARTLFRELAVLTREIISQKLGDAVTIND